VNERDRKELVARYEERLAQHGQRPEALGWSRPDLQRRRFAALSMPILAQPSSSVLDIGCGFADLHAYLLANGWRGAYTGVDVVPGLLEGARRLHPELELRELDFSEQPTAVGAHDFVVASGIFNGRLRHEDHPAYVNRVLRAMFGHARVAACADFLSTWVNYQKPENWHADPNEWLAIGQNMTRRVVIRHDYLPFEFALYLYRDDRVGDGSIYEALR
jgi:SAM-dependent methyltransferase